MNDVDIIMYVLSFFIGLLFMFLSFTINKISYKKLF